MIQASHLCFSYKNRDADGNAADSREILKDVSLTIEAGSCVAIVGANGSGKSTLAKHLNAILQPDSGAVYVRGLSVSEPEHRYEIRRTVGMVFQNPDNQMVAAHVEEDVAFGPENLGRTSEEICLDVREALVAVHMWEMRGEAIDRLSGGQRQRVAAAGALAMRPECLVLDEATAMLSPDGRRELLDTVLRINRENHMTVIMITHDMAEAACVDRVILLDEGRVRYDGKPSGLFAQETLMEDCRIEPPFVSRVWAQLRRMNACGICGADGDDPESADAFDNRICDGEYPASMETLADRIGEAYRGYLRRDAERHVSHEFCACGENVRCESDDPESCAWVDGKSKQVCVKSDEKIRKDGKPILDPILRMEHVSFCYGSDTVYEKSALSDISLSLKKGEIVGLAGQTGAGKSTLMELLTGLLVPTEGTVYCRGKDIHAKKYRQKELRETVGMVFQQPAHQLFGDTVLEDVMFGLRDKKLSAEERLRLAHRALAFAGFPEEKEGQSPYCLSGGEKRRAAIAGALVTEPEYLILDEPAAGLDAVGKKELFSRLRQLVKQGKLGILWSSHDMNDLAEYCDRVIVLDAGKKKLDGTPAEVFSHEEELRAMGLDIPDTVRLVRLLADRGLPVKPDILTRKELFEMLGMWFGQTEVQSGGEPCSDRQA